MIIEPQRFDNNIRIPLTVDGTGTRRVFRISSLSFIVLVFVAWLFMTVLCIIFGEDYQTKAVLPLGVFVAAMVISRTLIVPERYFHKQREELVRNDYKFPYSAFWNIYDFYEVNPTVACFPNGVKGIYVQFDKDIIIGKEDGAEYDHYNAISEAYNMMWSRGIDAIHVDYMDTVGKDDRMDYLFERISDAENKDLREVMIRIFDGVQQEMNKAYASYDVYVFLFRGSTDQFIDEIGPILEQFRQANYVRHRVLNKAGLRDLVKAVINIDAFSIGTATDAAFGVRNIARHYLTPIWIEVDGHRTVLNKTSAEVTAEKRVFEAEQVARQTNKGVLKKPRRKRGEPDVEDTVDLFDDE